VVERVVRAVHVEVGTEMHDLWNMSDTLRAICACHHAAEVPAGPEWEDVHVVRVVSGLISLRHDAALEADMSESALHSLRVLGVTAPQLRGIQAEIDAHQERARRVLSASVKPEVLAGA